MQISFSFSRFSTSFFIAACIWLSVMFFCLPLATFCSFLTFCMIASPVFVVNMLRLSFSDLIFCSYFCLDITNSWVYFYFTNTMGGVFVSHGSKKPFRWFLVWWLLSLAFLSFSIACLSDLSSFAVCFGLCLSFLVIGIDNFKFYRRSINRCSVPGTTHVRQATEKTPPIKTPDPVPVKRNPLPAYNYHWDELPDYQYQTISDFCVADVETTGLDHHVDRIVQIALIRVSGGVIVDKFSTYVNPGVPISSGASAVNGIFDSDLIGAPDYSAIVDKVFDFVNDSTVLGHNVKFDLNFIADLFVLCGRPLSSFDFDYMDTMSYARRISKGLPNYKLQTLLSHFSIDHGRAHDADSDALATLRLFEVLRAREKLDKETQAARRRAEKEEEARVRRKMFAASPLLEKRFCFTGDFSAPRESMEAAALSVGAFVRGAVNSKTNYLVVGDISALPQWAKDRKHGKALELIAGGQRIEMIDEIEFYSLIATAKKAVNDSQAG